MDRAQGIVSPKLLMVLLAAASMGTSALLGLNLWTARPAAHQHTIEAVAVRHGQVADVAAAQRPIMSILPAFSLVNQSGQPTTNADLHGKVWIANFVFTRCSGPCPMLTSQMASLQLALKQDPRWADIRLVSVTVDPSHDSPEVLREYARLAHADLDHWWFLTGARDEVWSLIRNSFLLPVGDNPSDPAMPIFHSQKFVLVDQMGRVRGYYDAPDQGQIARLTVDLVALLADREGDGESEVQPAGAGPRTSGGA